MEQMEKDGGRLRQPVNAQHANVEFLRKMLQHYVDASPFPLIKYRFYFFKLLLLMCGGSQIRCCNIPDRKKT